MNSETVPSEIPIAMDEACTISLECWRLGRIAKSAKECNESLGFRHSVRRIAEALEKMGFSVIDFAGRNYDPGMVPEVVEAIEDPTLPRGHVIIVETVAPTVIWQGQVVKPGQVIVKRPPLRPQESIEVME